MSAHIFNDYYRNMNDVLASTYKTHIQNHGNLSKCYIDYRWHPEGDTPSMLPSISNAMHGDFPDPTWGGWGGRFRREGNGSFYGCWSQTGQDSDGKKSVTRFAEIWNAEFYARMDWAKDGRGNRKPVVDINGNSDDNVLLHGGAMDCPGHIQ